MKKIGTYPIIILSIVLQFYHSQLFSQFQGNVYVQSTAPNVVVNGTYLKSAWCGGINSVQINLADLNNDNKQDLVLYDQENNILKTFVNTGTAGQINYTYDPRYEKNFPEINYYLILKDYNCDGVPDLFHKGVTGVSVFKGYYAASELHFTYFKDLYYPSTFGPTNVYVQPNDIPAIIDMDGDGDLDILAFDVLGVYLNYYKNLRVENAQPCDSITMSFEENCWGKFYQTFYRTVTTGITCKGATSSAKKSRHSGNCISLLDIDGDGDKDFLGGNVSYSDLQLLINGGSVTNAIITNQDTTYNNTAHVLQMPTWPSPFHCDIDNDGDNDIIITTHNDNLSSANYNSVQWYKNTGTNAAPTFVFAHDSLLITDMIDVGRNSFPTFFDYDKDGKKDLFIGTEGYYNNTTLNLIAKLAYYRNTSTVGNISFERVSNDFLSLSIKNYKGIFPTFGDVTGDGVDDLVLGNADGTLAVYKNLSANNFLPPTLVWQTDSLPNIDAGKYSAPCVYDFNQDGKTDLLIGNQAGYIYYYEDTCHVGGIKQYDLKSTNLGNVKSSTQFFGYCVPTITRTDDINTPYLVVGNIDGIINRFDNFLNNTSTPFVRIDSNYSYIQAPPRSAPAITDIDGDGKYDMVIGNKLGGLLFYKQTLTVNNSTEEIYNKNNVLLYPNPSNSTLYLLLKANVKPNEINACIIDITGKIIQQNKLFASTNYALDIRTINRGIYFCVLKINDISISLKFVKE